MDFDICMIREDFDEYIFENARHFIEILFPEQNIQKIFIKVMCVLENLRFQYEKIKNAIEDIHKIIGPLLGNSTASNTSQEDKLTALVSIAPVLTEMQHNVFLKSIVECVTQKYISNESDEPQAVELSDSNNSGHQSYSDDY
ncbi:hypothetical protein RF11_02365 [Thelohanellus kitauei]|uniref:Uncharacterized protein n=1 Tax=Thelohanellus kitauei TaxID=669202 RepID=A0A0C2MT75_THEKT|nr:hypothetical protein RF11_02365 [Thelohanellus kitauei]